MANKVLLLLKMEVSELMRAARITAIIRPRRPGEKRGLRGQPAGEGQLCRGPRSLQYPEEPGVWGGDGLQEVPIWAGKESKSHGGRLLGKHCLCLALRP